MPDKLTPVHEVSVPWLNTPFDHLSSDVSPAIMSGGEWNDYVQDSMPERRQSESTHSDDSVFYV